MSGVAPRTQASSAAPGPAGSAAAPSRLAVLRLTLSDFRSYDTARLETDARAVVLVGPNGAGKTNLLEALSFLVPGRGLRQARLAEVARHDGAGGWAVAARLATTAGPVEIGTGRDAAAAAESERRAVRIDGEAARSQTALAEFVGAVWLTPQMDRLFVDGANGRRRFLDRLVFGFDPAHAGRVAAYENAMRQRARLLREGRGDTAWLAALEAAMAARGTAIAAARLDMVCRLNAAAPDPGAGFPQAHAAAAGEVEGWLGEMPAVDVEDRLAAMLAGTRERDAETGGAAVGPHRSDFAVHDRARGMPAGQCSTGEQKALLVSIVLAHAHLRATERGAAPLLLLDEIAAHLDAARRAALFETVRDVGAQAWMTGTDGAIFAALRGEAQFFRVQNSRLAPI